MYEQAASSMERMPGQPLATEQIAAAAAASKSGAGIWLLSHAKELLIGVASFAVGVGATLTATHLTGHRQETPSSKEHIAVVATDTLTNGRQTASDTSAVEKYSVPGVSETGRTPSLPSKPVETRTASAVPVTTSRNSQPMPNIQHSPSHTPNNEPVIIKKTVIQRDTVQIHETIIVRDTVVVN